MMVVWDHDHVPDLHAALQEIKVTKSRKRNFSLPQKNAADPHAQSHFTVYRDPVKLLQKLVSSEAILRVS
jgi:hypothetical protein